MPRPRPRLLWLTAALILLSWVASLGWLAARHLRAPTNTDLASRAALHLAPGDAWFAIVSGATQVGTASVTLDTLSPGFRVVEGMALTVPAGDTVVHSARITQTTLSPTLRIQEITGSWAVPGLRLAVASQQSRDSLTLLANPGEVRGALGPVLGVSGVHVAPYQMALADGLRAGRVLGTTMIDEWPTRSLPRTLRVGGDTLVVHADSAAPDPLSGHWTTVTTLHVPAMRLTMAEGSAPLLLVVDRRGRVQGLESLLGVRWIRQNLDLAQTAFLQRRDSETAAIRAAFPTLRALGTLRPVGEEEAIGPHRYLLAHRDGSPLIAALLPLLDDGRQQVRGDTLIIGPALATATAGEVAATDPFIGRLRSWPRQGPLPTTPDTVVALLDWLHTHIRVDTASAAPLDATGTLAAGRGHPDGVVRVFVALARRLGLEARIVTGFLPVADTLYTHPWVEVRTPGGWRSVDPVRGDAIASTALIRLGRDGFSAPWALWSHLANARVTRLPPPEPSP